LELERIIDHYYYSSWRRAVRLEFREGKITSL